MSIGFEREVQYVVDSNESAVLPFSKQPVLYVPYVMMLVGFN